MLLRSNSEYGISLYLIIIFTYNSESFIKINIFRTKTKDNDIIFMILYTFYYMHFSISYYEFKLNKHRIYT